MLPTTSLMVCWARWAPLGATLMATSSASLAVSSPWPGRVERQGPKCGPPRARREEQDGDEATRRTDWRASGVSCAKRPADAAAPS